MDIEERNKLVLEYKNLAYHLVKKLLYTHPYIKESFADLLDLSIIVLIQCLDKYNGSVPIGPYLTTTIVCRLLDEFRKLDPVSRPVREIGREISKSKLPSDELATQLGITRKRLDDAKTQAYYSYSYFPESIPIEESYCDKYFFKEQLSIVLKALKKLPKNYHFVIYQHYFQHKNFYEISKELGISKAGVYYLFCMGMKELKRKVKTIRF